MNLRILTVTLAGVALSWGTIACNNEELTGISRNPNAPESVGADRLFPSVVTAAAGVVVAHPVAQGNWISFNATGCSNPFGQWDCVNDEPLNAASGGPSTHDGNASFLQSRNLGTTVKSSFKLAGSLLPAGAIVTTLTLYASAAKGKAAGRDPQLRLFYDSTGFGANVFCPGGATRVFGEAYVLVSCSFTGLSLTSLPEVGIEETTKSNNLRVTQVYAQVAYQ